jgi:hypothetical protein
MVIQSILRKEPFGFAKKVNFPRMLRPNNVTSRSINPRPIKYAVRPIKPEVISRGSTVASSRE